MDVDSTRYPANWYPGSVDQYEAAGAWLADELSHLEIEDLLARCRLVVAANRATNPQRPGGPEPGVTRPRALDWLLCVAAIHRMGESREERWLEALAEVSQWEEPVVGLSGTRVRLDSSLFILRGRAYQKILLSEASPREIVAVWREIQIGGASERGIDTRGVPAAFRELLRERPARPEFVEALSELFTDPDVSVRRRMSDEPISRLPPELHDLRMAMLADPDPIVRRKVAAPFLNEHRPLRGRAAPLLLRFLARDDIDDPRARQVALQALRIYGYELGLAPDGRPMAVPVEPNLAPITLPAAADPP